MSLYVPFLGIVNVPIKTYTTTYTSPNGGSWQLDTSNIEAMDFQSFGTGTTIQGARGNIFSRAFMTPFSIGSVAGSAGGYGACAWFNNKLAVVGSSPNGTGQLQPVGFATQLPLNGIGVTIPGAAFGLLKTIPNLTNTVTPSPRLGWGGPAAAGGALGVHYSYRINLVDFAAVWDGVTNVQGSVAAPSFDTTHTFNACIPNAAGTNNICPGRGDGSPTTDFYMQSDLLTATALFQTAVFQNPTASTLNVNTVLHVTGATNGFRATSLGFLQLYTDTQTVNGVTMAGYGLLILPNFAGYYLFNITGTDALSLTWASAGSQGGRTGAMGAANDLFIKWANTPTTLFISGSPVVLPAAPGPTPAPSLSFLRQRAWSYTLDGHTFYVLDLGAEGTFLYDITTQQWSNFNTAGFTQWDAANGVMWGNRVVAGDLLTGDVWEVAASTTQDNGGLLDISHVATGSVMTRSREFHSVDDVRLAVSKGYYDNVLGSVMYLRYSDDNGTTWSAYLPHALTEGLTKGSLSWRSLGAFQAPGRIFEFSDSGGPFRLDGADVFIDNFDDDSAPPAQGG